jgi:predicted Zn-dependent protease
MALPGGAILVTRGLLETLGSEAELVAVLAHELGHIEQGHCFDAVKFSLTARKIGAAPLGNLADMTVDLLIGHSFSKTQEAEADQYSFMALVNSDYDPNAVGNAFDSMLAYAKKREVTPATSGLNPIRDYFMSHPPLELRGAKYRGEARLWWDRHPNEVRYVGEANLRERRHIKSMTMPSEWMSGGDPGA